MVKSAPTNPHQQIRHSDADPYPNPCDPILDFHASKISQTLRSIIVTHKMHSACQKDATSSFRLRAIEVDYPTNLHQSVTPHGFCRARFDVARNIPGEEAHQIDKGNHQEESYDESNASYDSQSPSVRLDLFP